MEKYFKINADGCSICCKLYSNGARRFDRVIVAPHGFAGHKDNRAAARFSDKLLKKHKNVAVVTYDLPCHGDDVRQHLSLDDCDMYMSNVLSYCSTVLGAVQIYCYATSFGAYLSLKYMSEHENPFCKTVLRCPAVNMYEILWNTILSDSEKQLLLDGKAVETGFDRKVKIDTAFIDGLRENDIGQRDFLALSESIFIINAGLDEVVSPTAVQEFADDNCIELVRLDRADHRISDPTLMSEAIKAALSFFSL